MKIESWLKTYTGINIDPLNASADEISIDDIAHALANICRFAGHVREFYSVAQHSVIVSQILESKGYSPVECLQGLLHDATEAYMVDVPKPIKVQDLMRGYCEAEDRLELIIADAFGFDRLVTPAVKMADVIALATEARDLMGDPKDWVTLKGVQTLTTSITPLAPQEAKALFYGRFLQLSAIIDERATVSGAV